jgi:hypothetical protein
MILNRCALYRVFFFKFHLIRVDCARTQVMDTDQLFKCYVLHEWCVHNRFFNAYYEVKLKKHPILLPVDVCTV